VRRQPHTIISETGLTCLATSNKASPVQKKPVTRLVKITSEDMARGGRNRWAKVDPKTRSELMRKVRAASVKKQSVSE
jgi:hypothetical protein